MTLNDLPISVMDYKHLLECMYISLEYVDVETY